MSSLHMYSAERDATHPSQKEKRWYVVSFNALYLSKGFEVSIYDVHTLNCYDSRGTIFTLVRISRGVVKY